MTIGANGQIEYRYVRKPGTVEVPRCSTISGIEDDTVSADIEMGGICRVNYECVHRNIGDASTVDRCPCHSAGAGVVEIGCLPNMFPCDCATVAIERYIDSVRIVWINNCARDVSIGHTCRGHVSQRV